MVINEILFNPPGPDIPNEYVELRGPPHAQLIPGTYLVVVEGDTNGNPGLVQNVFDLSGQQFGGNGFLVLAQKTNRYTVQPGATVLVNTGSEEGFGSGSSSSVHHEGEHGQVDLEDGSATFFLIQATNKPAVDQDIDDNNDGIPNGLMFAEWTVLDSIGVLDNDGLGDIAYGAINFRRNNRAQASGNIVPMGFTADYIARIGNATGSAATNWVAGGSLEGEAPYWLLGDPTDTTPSGFSDRPLDHIGGPNFGATNVPGILIIESDYSTEVSESGAKDSFALALNTAPAGPVRIELRTDGQTEISTNQGASFQSVASVTLNSTAPVSVQVRAVDNLVVQPSPHLARITQDILATSDPSQYPLTSPLPDLTVRILDNDLVLLSELKVNPPGPEDAPFEFIEIRGVPYAPLTNVLVLALDGDVGGDPGKVSAAFDLTGSHLGSNGLLLIAAVDHPYSFPPETTVVLDPQLDTPGGVLENGSTSFLLLTTSVPIQPGDDLDRGDNGILEGLPNDATLLDAVGWSDGDSNDWVFGGVVLSLPSGTPDAATRFPNDPTPLSAAAWFAGNLLGDTGDSLVYDPSSSTTNFPPGSALNPGRSNNTAPSITSLPPWSGAIDDPTNPKLEFVIHDAESPLQNLTLTASSTNPAVVPDSNLILTPVTPGRFCLSLDPVGVGYATITIQVSDGEMTGFTSFPYAASAAGYPDSRFHFTATDASTAIAIDPDLMFVGDDETQILRLYHRHLSGPPINGFDMTPFLGLTDFEGGKPREVDIEGSTRVGNRIYWIGSHSHADIGETRTNRARLFATDLSGSGPEATLSFVGRYEHLKEDLVDWDMSNGHGKGADYYGLAASAADGVIPKEPHGAGFNIEGLTMAPGSTQVAWICFRAPIVPAANRLYALIVPVLNFADLAVGNGPHGSAVFGDPIELDFQGRGFRSIEGDTNGYLIITGPPSNIPTPFPPSDYKTYTWSGRPEDPPQQHPADFTDLNPETIVELPPHPWTADSQFQIISDNGRTIFYNDDVPGKKLPELNFKKSRSDIVTLGPVVRPEPFFTQITVADNQVHLVWRSNPGDAYRLQFKDSLDSSPWTDRPGDITASGPLTSRSEPLETQPRGFYRVQLLP